MLPSVRYQIILTIASYFQCLPPACGPGTVTPTPMRSRSAGEWMPAVLCSSGLRYVTLHSEGTEVEDPTFPRRMTKRHATRARRGEEFVFQAATGSASSSAVSAGVSKAKADVPQPP